MRSTGTAARRAALEAVLRLGDALNDGVVVADALSGLLESGAVDDPEALAFRLAALRREQDDSAGVERALVLGFHGAAEQRWHSEKRCSSSIRPAPTPPRQRPCCAEPWTPRPQTSSSCNAWS